MELSIIIPAFNVEKYITNTLKSLINQSKKEFEIIVINDGSTDDTYIVTKKFMESNSHKDYKIINKENGGVSSARNRGLEEAIGKYVLFLDSDDYLSKHAVETILKKIETSQQIDVVCWGFDIVREDKSIIKNYFNHYDKNTKNLSGEEALRLVTVKEKMWICTGSAIIRKDFLDEHLINYSEGCINGEDLEFTYKVLSKANRVEFINKVLLFYVNREGSISNSYNIKKFDAVYAMERACEFIVSGNIGSSNYEDIVKYIMNQRILLNYYSSLHSCWSCSEDINIRRIITDIDDKYPDLNKKIRTIMREYEGKDMRMKFRNLLFLISPWLFFILIRMKNRILKIYNIKIFYI